MMIACIQRIPQRRFFILTLLCLLMPLTIPVASFGQGYSNPQYRAPQPKKGQAAEVPSYSSPADTSTSSPSYSNPGYSTPTSESGSTPHSSEIAANVTFPTAVGDAGQGLQTKFGGNLAFFFSPIISDDFKNFISVGYDTFSLKADLNSSFRLIPFTFGIQTPPQPGKTISPVFGIALGGAYAWISVPESLVFSGRTYFLGQLRPGLEVDLDGLTLVIQTPINFLLGNSRMSFIDYSFGARFGI